MMRSLALSLVFSTLFIAVSVGAATTISTNITTEGTLSVTGASTLTGAVTTAGAVTLGNAASDAIIITGNASTTNGLTVGSSLWVNGYATTTGSSGNFASAGTLSVTGNATSSAAHHVGATLTVNGYATTTSSGVISTQAVSAHTLPFASTTAITATTASTTNLIVGGNSTNGTLAGVIFGTCDLTGVSITATTTKSLSCASATGVTTAFKVFVQATSSLARHITVPQQGDFLIGAASSTADGTIGVNVTNLTGGNATPWGTLNFWAVK